MAKKKAVRSVVTAGDLALVGLTITALDLRPFDDGRGGSVYNPKLTLSDGRTVSFTVQETETAGYGVRLIVAGKAITPAPAPPEGYWCNDCGIPVASPQPAAPKNRVVRCENCARFAAL